MADDMTGRTVPDEIKKESQVIELIGRNHVVSELLHLGYEVAFPARDRGLDFIVYQDLGVRFQACPVQLKVASKVSFGIDRKYRVFPNMLIVYVWNVNDRESMAIFALTYAEAVAVADSLQGSPDTAWMRDREKGRFVQSCYSEPLATALLPHRMTEERWHNKLNLVFEGQVTGQAVSGM